MSTRITPKQPLAEVFGFPINNLSPEAERYRRNKLCPFNNRVPNCTKDKANNPLGVCSVFDESGIAITCPVRFRQEWIVAEDAANFFFPNGATWTSLTEVRLNDRNGKSAGNVDVVLVQYDDRGKVIDFGALEIQAVYISGNVRIPFEHYIEDPRQRANLDWSRRPNYPRPDYLSSSRKRLAPQLLFKGGILNAWRKKIAVALDSGFWATLPPLPEVAPHEAEVVWLVYDLIIDRQSNAYRLARQKTVYTAFDVSLERLTRPDVGDPGEFIHRLQNKLDEKLEDGTPPENQTLDLSL